MRLAILTYTLAIIKTCTCMGSEVILDLSDPDPSVARVHENRKEGVVYKTVFPRLEFFTRVQNGSEEIWRSSGDKRCTVAFASYRPTRTLLTIHTWVRGGISEMRYYERLGEEWREIDRYDECTESAREPVSIVTPEEIGPVDYFQVGTPGD